MPPRVPRLPESEPHLLKPADVARILSSTVSQVMVLLRSGELPSMRLGGRGAYRVDPKRLQQWIDDQHDKTRDEIARGARGNESAGA